MDMLKSVRIPAEWKVGPEYLPDELCPIYNEILWDNNYATIYRECGDVTYYILIADNANYFKTDGQKYCVHLFKVGKGIKPNPDYSHMRGLRDDMDFMCCYTYYYKRETNREINDLLKRVEKDLLKNQVV